MDQLEQQPEPFSQNIFTLIGSNNNNNKPQQQQQQNNYNNKQHYNQQTRSPRQNNYNNYNNYNNNNQQQQQQQAPRPQANPKQTAWAANELGVEAGDLIFYDEIDPLNKNNKLCGYVSRSTDSMLLVSVNGVPLLPPLSLRSPPPLAPVFSSDDRFAVSTKSDFSKYFLSYKWNGNKIQVYKYPQPSTADKKEDKKSEKECEWFVTARSRSSLVLRDYEVFKPLSIFVNCISRLEPAVSLPLTMANLPPIFFPLNFDVQSITCELFGTSVPHLINYPFDYQLKALYYTHNQGGAICPISDIEEGLIITPTDTEETITQTLATAVEAGLGLYCGPIPFTPSPDDSSIESMCRLLTKKAHELNVNHRIASGASATSSIFAIEGWVLHLLDENGLSVNRSMYSLQPADFREARWDQFDVKAQKKALNACQEILRRGKPVTPYDMRRELSLSFAQWSRFSKDVMTLVDGIPLVSDVSQRPKNAKRLIILCGIPGSGKSTFSKQLIGKGWERCNQDELGNRKQVENAVIGHLKAGKNVIVDRCNFDYSQRHIWIKLAASFGIKWITCIVLRTDPEVCKKRVSVREGHETIPTGEEGAAIIDKFKDWWVEPHPAEGFCEIVELRNDLEIENTVQKLTIHHLENKVDNMENTISQLQRKVKELEAESRKAKQQMQQQQAAFISNPYAAVSDVQ